MLPEGVIAFMVHCQWLFLTASLQERPFHAGGLSALNILRYAHYLPIGGEKTISLYGEKTPPAWIRQTESLSFTFHKKPLFRDLGLKKQHTSIRDWQITISSPERAILELLYQVDDRGITFQFCCRDI